MTYSPSSLPPPVRDTYVLFLPYVGSLNDGGSLNTRWGMPTAGLPLGVGGRCLGAQMPRCPESLLEVGYSGVRSLRPEGPVVCTADVS